MRYVAAVFAAPMYIAGQLDSWVLMGLCAVALGLLFAHTERREK